jgi:hypothetical protein
LTDAVDDPIPILTRFHREVVLPDIQRTVGELREEMNARFAEVFGHFDAIYQRFDRLDGLQEQVRTLEARLEE